LGAKIAFFPVDNGDMTLIRLADTRVTTLLIDIKIRKAADDPADDTPDVAAQLRKRLQYDTKGRPFVDVFLLSHPDQDHISGLKTHFWLGSPEDYPDDQKKTAEKRIIIKEIWSSPMVFRRHEKTNHVLCQDAKDFASEVRRRVKKWKENRWAGDGNRIIILGEDEGNKTDDLQDILVKTGETLDKICGTSYSSYFSALLLAPAPRQEDELEDKLSKNNSSVIMRMKIFASQHSANHVKFLSGGDAGVLIWERLWEKYKHEPEVLEYDLLQAPHHCSWRSISYDSWSEKGKDAKVCEGARHALSQALDGATIVSSSAKIVDDENDPPCIRAKDEYKSILKPGDGAFLCTGDDKAGDETELEIQANGKLVRIAVGAAAAGLSVAAAATPRAGKS
jgi:hypothetical protein